jgi:polar amino acid transport system substrate-binding protein
MIKKMILALCCLCICACALALNHPLKIGITDTEPFSIVKPGAPVAGISVMTWEQIALMNHWSYQYIVLNKNFDDNLTALEKGRIDLLIDPIPVTSERLARVDFSRPILIQNIAVIMPKNTDVKNVFSKFFGGALIFIVTVGILLFLVYIHLIWFFERGKMPDIPQTYRKGITTLIWLHLLNKGVGLPETAGGKIILLSGIILFAVFLTSYNASLTSLLTTALKNSTQKITRFDDLRNLSSCAVKGQLPYLLAKEEGLNVRPVASTQEGIQLLEQKKVDAVIVNFFVGAHYLNNHLNAHKKYGINILSNQARESAFAFPYDSPIKTQLNLSLIKLRELKQIYKICTKYFSTQEAEERCTL